MEGRRVEGLTGQRQREPFPLTSESVKDRVTVYCLNLHGTPAAPAGFLDPV